MTASPDPFRGLYEITTEVDLADAGMNPARRDFIDYSFHQQIKVGLSEKTLPRSEFLSEYPDLT